MIEYDKQKKITEKKLVEYVLNKLEDLSIRELIGYFQEQIGLHEKENCVNIFLKAIPVYDYDENGYEFTNGFHDFNIVGKFEETNEEFKARIKKEKLEDKEKKERREQEKIDFHTETLNDLGFDVTLTKKKKDYSLI